MADWLRVLGWNAAQLAGFEPTISQAWLIGFLLSIAGLCALFWSVIAWLDQL